MPWSSTARMAPVKQSDDPDDMELLVLEFGGIGTFVFQCNDTFATSAAFERERAERTQPATPGDPGSRSSSRYARLERYKDCPGPGRPAAGYTLTSNTNPTPQPHSRFSPSIHVLHHPSHRHSHNTPCL
jgi:hypothetical protein